MSSADVLAANLDTKMDLLIFFLMTTGSPIDSLVRLSADERYQSLTTNSKFAYNFKNGLNSYLSLIDWKTCLKPLDLCSEETSIIMA